MAVPADTLVQACRVADFDAVAQVCAAPFWTYPPTMWPALSIADAQEIGMAVALLWATAYGFRVLRKALQEIG